MTSTSGSVQLDDVLQLRRRAASVALSAAVLSLSALGALPSTPALPAAVAADLTPYEEAKKIELGPTYDG